MEILGKAIEKKLNFKQSVLLLAGLVSLLLILSSISSPKNRGLAFADTSSLTGYAWSDNIGWISLSGSGYGLSVDSTQKLSGYAWSDNIGWISANESDLTGCPSGSCLARIQSGHLNGWLRALGNGGGWDGWISLSGSGYGATQDAVSGALSGYAWGSDVVGWLDFSHAIAPLACSPVYSCSGTQTILYTNSFCDVSTYATCTLPTFCSAGSSTCLYPNPEFVSSSGLTGHLQLLPALLSSGETTQVHWDVNNVTTCTISGSNGDTWTVAGPDSSSGSSGETSRPIVGQTTYTLSCGSYPGVSPATITETQAVNIIPVFQEL